MSNAISAELSTLADLERKYGKLKLADHARMMADNQRTLDDVAAATAADRSFLRRLVQSRAGLPAADGPPAEETGEPEMQIAIDSPTTVNHNYPAPTAASPAPSAPGAIAAIKTRLSGLAKAGILAAILGSGAAGYAIPKLASILSPAPSPAPIVEPAPQAGRDYQLEFRVLPAAEK